MADKHGPPGPLRPFHRNAREPKREQGQHRGRRTHADPEIDPVQAEIHPPEERGQCQRAAHLSRCGLERIAKQRIDDAGYWERRHRGYRFLKCYSRYNRYNGCWYVSVVMYKTDGDPPEWTMPDWMEQMP